MRAIVIGGTSSGVGKTSLACRILEVLPGWGALKTSPREGVGTYEIVRDEATLWLPGSDTCRYLRAGAEEVAWLCYRREHLEAGMREALSIFENRPGVVIEGNSAAKHVSPTSHVILVSKRGWTEMKKSATALLPRANRIVVNLVPDDHGSIFGSFSKAEVRKLMLLDVEDYSDPGADAFLEGIVTWARRPA
jgi:hypothetical protein